MPIRHRVLLHVALAVVALVLCWLALRGVQLREIYAILRLASSKWLVLLVAITLLSHVIRAWRWQLLLDTLRVTPRVSLSTAIGGTMIGLMVNYALPRVGEVARAGHVSAQANLGMGATLGTVVVERALDVSILLVGLGASFVYLIDRSEAVQDALVKPILAQLASIAPLSIAAGIVATGGVALLATIVVRKFVPLRSVIKRSWLALRDGLASATRTRRKPALAVSSILMFLLYGVMAYIPLVMFEIAGPYNLSFADGLAIMFIGVLGVVVPTPGGIGSFHYITRVTLVSLFGVPASLAVTYAVFLHGAQLLLYLIVGCLVMVVQGANLGGLFARKSTGKP